MKNNTYTKPSFVALVIAALILAFCAVTYFGYNGTNTETSESIKIGAALALTGEAAPWGEASKNAIMLAVEEINASGGINGNKLEVVIEDMKSSSKDSVSAVSKLVNVDKVKAVMVTWLDSYQGSETVVPENMPLISPDAAIESVNEDGRHQNVFSLWYRTAAKAAVTFEAMKKAKIKTVYVITQNDSYYSTLVQFLKVEAQKSGIRIIAAESLNPGSDSRTIMSKIQAAKPEAIFFGAYDEKISVDFPKRYGEMIKGKIPIFADEFLKQNIDVKKVNTSWVLGAHYYVPAESNSEFAKRYQARFGHAPEFSAVNSYDTVRILAKYLADRPRDLSKYMTKTIFESETYGSMQFDHIGGVISDVSAIVEKQI